MTKLTCQEVLDQLWEYLDPSVQAELKDKIDAHLGGCQHCTVEVDTLLKTVSLFTCPDHVVMPIQLSERVQEALRRAYASQSARPASD